MYYYRKRTVKLLLILLIIFAAIFFFTIRNLEFQVQSSIFALGIPYENWIVLVFSVAAIAKVVFELYRIESHSNYEMRIRKEKTYY